MVRTNPQNIKQTNQLLEAYTGTQKGSETVFAPCSSGLSLLEPESFYEVGALESLSEGSGISLMGFRQCWHEALEVHSVPAANSVPPNINKKQGEK